MQTMPTKNRTSLMLAGIGLLVVVGVMGAITLNQRAKQAPAPDDLEQVAGPENGAGLVQSPDAVNDAAAPAVTNPDTQSATGTDTTPQTGQEVAGAAPDQGSQGVSTLTAVPETHVVKEGDTLYSISMQYYGKHIYAGDIEALNGIEDPNQIVAGMELKLPRPETLAKAAE